MANSLAGRLRGAKNAGSSSTNDANQNQSTNYEDEYIKLEKELQKYENKVRINIKVQYYHRQNEQYLKNHVETLERKIESQKEDEHSLAKEIKVVRINE